MKRKPLFRGTGTALVTPFDTHGGVDLGALAALVRFQSAAGVEAILPVGTTGESVTLTDAEQAIVIATVRERAPRKVKVIAGAGSNSTAKTVQLARSAARAGADGLLCVAPYYNKPTQEGFYRHYAEIAASTDLPIIMYNVPGRTASNMTAETTLRLAEDVPNINGIKEASGNFEQIMEILRRRPKGFGVWSGDDAITFPMMALGADGVVSVVSNEVPREFSGMVRLCLRGKYDAALRIHNRLLPLMTANFIESNPIPVKAALAMMGKIGERYRLPLVPMGRENRKKFARIVRGLKLA
ncbi:MAG TPA: 4-hydroxy-tetrahydrodipicolinate synthase [Bacteroidota bacterium]|nr:4-hydroxy-tetrahydrodipicolinate synthase [Bacteroidota bacterium]